MFTKSRTGGGVGTNQYRIKGRSCQSVKGIPDLAFQVMDHFNAEQLGRMGDIQTLKEMMQTIRRELPNARYVSFYWTGDAQWTPEHIADASGSEVADSEDMEDIMPMMPCLVIDPDMTDPWENHMTIDLDQIEALGPCDELERVAAEYVLRDILLAPDQVTHWVSSPYPQIKTRALSHPNCPEHIKIIGVLGT